MLPLLLGSTPAVSQVQTSEAVAPADARPRPVLSLSDSLAAVRISEAAAGDPRRRIVVSLGDRRLFLMERADTLLSALIAVGSGEVLQHDGQSWDFSTPRGRRNVLRKVANPVWVPPDWHYVELARRWGWRIARLGAAKSATLADGSRLTVRGRHVVRIHKDGRTNQLPSDQEIVIDGTLFIPPVGTSNREIREELGRYMLDLGDGYLLHGTPHHDSIGQAATHGCLRLRDADIEYLFEHAPVGTSVYIY